MSNTKRSYATIGGMLATRSAKRPRSGLEVTAPPNLPSPMPAAAASAGPAPPAPKRRCFLFLRVQESRAKAIEPLAFDPVFGAYVFRLAGAVVVQYRDASSGTLHTREYADSIEGRGIEELGPGSMLWEDGMPPPDCLCVKAPITQVPDPLVLADHAERPKQLTWVRPALPAPNVPLIAPADARRRARAGWKRLRAASSSSG